MRQTDTGALIAQLRKEQGLTQKQLAEQLHISDRTISKWEREFHIKIPHPISQTHAKQYSLVNYIH